MKLFLVKGFSGKERLTKWSVLVTQHYGGGADGKKQMALAGTDRRKDLVYVCWQKKGDEETLSTLVYFRQGHVWQIHTLGAPGKAQGLSRHVQGQTSHRLERLG